MPPPRSPFGDLPVEQAQPQRSPFGDLPVNTASPGGPQEPQGSATGRFLSNFGATINPVPGIKALWNDPKGTLKNLVNAQGKQFTQAGADLGNTREMPALSDRLLSAAGHGLAGLLPVVGPAAANAGEQIGSGDVAGGLGSAAGLVAPIAGGKYAARGLGKLSRAAAEPITESALGIRKVDRAFGKTPGAAALDETTAVRPGTIADQAQNRLNALNATTEDLAAKSPNQFPLSKGRSLVASEHAKAVGQNAAKTAQQLEPMREHLTTDLASGQPLPADVPMSKGLELQRGFGDEYVHNWNPETLHGVKGTASRVYHELGEGFDPEIKDIRGRMSDLIPVARRAESTDLNAGLGQRMLHRIGAHTGALTGAALGFHYGGVPGSLAGLAIPEILASPTTQMIGARGLDMAGKALKSPVAGRAAQSLPLFGRRGER